MYELPVGAEPMNVDGFYVNAEQNLRGITLRLLKNNHQRFEDHGGVHVNYADPPYWRTPRETELQTTVRLMVNSTIFTGQYAGLYGELLAMARVLCEALDSDISDKLAEVQKRAEEEEKLRQEARAKYEEERQQRLAEQARLAQIRNARGQHLYELVKWNLGDFTKLTRDGYRSTVFGTIDRVVGENIASPYMEITTEKGKYMRIMFQDVNRMWLKNEDKKYDIIYQTGDETKEVSA